MTRLKALVGTLKINDACMVAGLGCFVVAAALQFGTAPAILVAGVALLIIGWALE